MKNYEIGILPESSYFSFSPNAQTKELFLYPTMCGHLFCTREYYIKRNYFPRLLLIYVCSGTFHLKLEAQEYHASDGQVLLFDCTKPHHYYATDALEFYYLHFDGAQAHELCRYINSTSGIVIDSPNNIKVRNELHDLVQFYENNNSESILASSGRIYRILTLLDNPVISPQLQKHGDAINEAVRHIRSNVGKKITLHELAELCGLSDYYFSHIFKEITGFSPSNFITFSRIDQAKSLLANSSMTLPQIAKQVGYTNSSNLIVQFTSRVGCTPQEFRAQHQGE